MSWRDHIENLQEHLKEIDDVQIERLLDVLWNAFMFNKRIFIVGNGGSAANASHFAQDLCKATYPAHDGLKMDSRNKTFKAISLCDNISFITAVANDDGYQYIFTSQLKVHAPSEEDVLIAISGSGNSSNILRVVDLANSLNMTTVGITGYDGGHLINHTKLKVHVKVFDMRVVESIHSIIFHYVIEKLMSTRIYHNV